MAQQLEDWEGGELGKKSKVALLPTVIISTLVSLVVTVAVFFALPILIPQMSVTGRVETLEKDLRDLENRFTVVNKTVEEMYQAYGSKLKYIKTEQ